MSREDDPATAPRMTGLGRLPGARAPAAGMRQTGLPTEAFLGLAIEMLELASRRLSPAVIHRTAVGLGTARWRNVSPEERSETLRRAAQARWAKEGARKKTEK